MIATTLTTVDASQRTLARQKTREALRGGGKERVRILWAEPLNAETPLEDLGDDLTAQSQFFVRSHFRRPNLSPRGHVLEVVGAVERALRLKPADLEAMGTRTVTMTLECAERSHRTHAAPVGGAVGARRGGHSPMDGRSHARPPGIRTPETARGRNPRHRRGPRAPTGHRGRDSVRAVPPAREGEGPGHAPRPPDERPADPPGARRAGPADRPGLVRHGQREMARADRGARGVVLRLLAARPGSNPSLGQLPTHP